MKLALGQASLCQLAMMLCAGTGTSDWKQYATKHAAKVKSRVRKGIPDRLRGVAWQLLSGGRDLLMQNEGLPSTALHTCLLSRTI